jgi:hypothetical protein
MLLPSGSTRKILDIIISEGQQLGNLLRMRQIAIET